MVFHSLILLTLPSSRRSSLFQTALRIPEVALRLQVHPKFWCGSERLRQKNGRLRRDGLFCQRFPPLPLVSPTGFEPDKWSARHIPHDPGEYRQFHVYNGEGSGGQSTSSRSVPRQTARHGIRTEQEQASRPRPVFR